MSAPLNHDKYDFCPFPTYVSFNLVALEEF